MPLILVNELADVVFVKKDGLTVKLFEGYEVAELLELTLTERGALIVQQVGQNILSDVAFSLGVQDLEGLHHVVEGVGLEAVHQVGVFGLQMLEHELFKLLVTDLFGQR